jgi:hypothetical protein
MKAELDEERNQITGAAVKLGKEKAALEVKYNTCIRCIY